MGIPYSTTEFEGNCNWASNLHFRLGCIFLDPRVCFDLVPKITILELIRFLSIFVRVLHVPASLRRPNSKFKNQNFNMQKWASNNFRPRKKKEVQSTNNDLFFPRISVIFVFRKNTFLENLKMKLPQILRLFFQKSKTGKFKKGRWKSKIWSKMIKFCFDEKTSWQRRDVLNFLRGDKGSRCMWLY